MSQEPRLFAGTLRDNILMGRAHADVRALVPILQLTGLDKVAAAHPMGLDMPVGEGGCLLSGGQRQLVALARCLITRPQVLLLDEPTSAMDAQAEALFVKHLKAVAEGKTLVVVTHRPAILEVVDLIAVVENGRLIAFGPKGQVMAALASGRPPGMQTGAMQAVPAQPPAGMPGPRAAVPPVPAQAVVAAAAPAAQAPAQAPVPSPVAAPAMPAAAAAPSVSPAVPPPGVAERAPVLDTEAEAPSVARPYTPPPDRRTLPDGVPDLSMPPSEVAE
jgi:ATP-binding cassette subfamily C protein LapB